MIDLQFGIAPLILAAGIGALAKGIGGWLGGKSKQKKEEAAAKEGDRAGRATHAEKEKARVASLRTMQAQAASRGISMPYDESLFAERPYTGADPTKVTGAGKGFGFASALASGLGGVAADAGQADLLGAGQPVGGLGVEEIERIAAEAGVSPEDVMELLNEEIGDRATRGERGTAL